MKYKNPYVGDIRTKLAKQKGYPARSVFKLEEIDQRCALLKVAMRVLDLGAAPGSWTMYAASKVGARGLVIAVELEADCSNAAVQRHWHTRRRVQPRRNEVDRVCTI